MKESTQILILSTHNVGTPVAWSGTPHFCVRGLEQNATILKTISPLFPESPTAAKWKRDVYRKQGRRYMLNRDLKLLKRACEASQSTLDECADADAIILFNSSDAVHLETPVPIGIVLDATWKQFTDSYDGFRPNELCEETYRDGCIGERLAFERARWLFPMTEWAAEGIRREYPEAASKIHVTLPGANLYGVPNPEEVETMIQRRLQGGCNIVLCGVEPQRKGLDIASRACEILRANGIEAVLQMVGVDLSNWPEKPEFIESHGFLRKDVPAEYARLQQIYEQAHLLILPTRAECAGIVLCEAAAFGVPAVISGAGGSPELVRHGETGLVVGVEASPETYAEAVLSLYKDPSLYVSLSRAARARYDSLLNWDVAARGFLRAISARTQ